MCNNSHNRAVLDDSIETSLNSLLLFLDVDLLDLGKGLFLGMHPVFIESSESVFVELVGPNSGESSESSRSFDVTDETNDDHGRSFDDGDGFDDFLLVEFYRKKLDSREEEEEEGEEEEKEEEEEEEEEKEEEEEEGE